jgi:hypothetical protein
MGERVYISKNNTATFVCPNCENTTTADVTRYAKMDKTVHVNIKCRCGHAFQAVLEKRRRYRKATRLPGTYTYEGPNGVEDKGIMQVVDISSSGLKLKLNVGRAFKLGDRIRVEFNLDDPQHTAIDKVVIVKNVSKEYVGVAFNEREGDDPSLGFYLLK